MSEISASAAAKRRAMRPRKFLFPAPPRDYAQPPVSVMHPAHLPPARESATALLNAALVLPPLDPAAESRADRVDPGTGIARGSPGEGGYR